MRAGDLMATSEDKNINSLAELYLEFKQPIFRYLFRLAGCRQTADPNVNEFLSHVLMNF